MLCNKQYHVPTQVAGHEAPVKTCHWIKAPNYTCLMTASWDKTLKVSYYFLCVLKLMFTLLTLL